MKQNWKKIVEELYLREHRTPSGTFTHGEILTTKAELLTVIDEAIKDSQIDMLDRIIRNGEPDDIAIAVFGQHTSLMSKTVLSESLNQDIDLEKPIENKKKGKLSN